MYITFKQAILMTASDIDMHYMIAVARHAGAEMIKVYESDFNITRKSDNSPVTEADLVSNKVIVDAIHHRYPGSDIISEENKQIPYEVREKWHTLWMIDPLDGTKEFIKRNGEFTVNIALIENGIPTLGIVYAPVPDILYYASKGYGSFKVVSGITTKLHSQVPYTDKDHVKVIGSRSHMNADTLAFVDALKQQGKNVDFLSIGSSLKLCMVAEGEADVYPRFSPTMEWDTAAAHAVALYAGRQVLDAQTKEPLTYNKPALLNPNFIVC